MCSSSSSSSAAPAPAPAVEDGPLYLLPTELRLLILHYALTPLPHRLRFKKDPAWDGDASASGSANPSLNPRPAAASASASGVAVRPFKCPPLLLVNRRLSSEASQLLYGSVALSISPSGESLRRLALLPCHTHVRHLDLALPLAPLDPASALPMPVPPPAPPTVSTSLTPSNDDGPNVFLALPPEKLLPHLRYAAPALRHLTLAIVPPGSFSPPPSPPPHSHTQSYPPAVITPLVALTSQPTLAALTTCIRMHLPEPLTTALAHSAISSSLPSAALAHAPTLPRLARADFHFETPLSYSPSLWSGFYRGSTREARRDMLTSAFAREAELLVPLCEALGSLFPPHVEVRFFRAIRVRGGLGAERIWFHADWMRDADRQVQWLLERRILR